MNDICPLVSIIIPVYNGEDFLDTCIQSAIKQSYSNIEIIIVNDGSTDKTTLIIDKYVSCDKRVVRLDQKNGGPAFARKKGLDFAKGKYVQYLDSDDSLHENAIELLSYKAEVAGADIVVAPFRICYSDGRFQNSFFFDFAELTGTEYLKHILNDRAYWSVWSKFHKRDLFLKEPMEIFPGICFGEDVIWSVQLLLRAKKVVALEQMILDYNIRMFSLSHSCNFNEKKFANFEFYTSWLGDYLKGKEMRDAFEKDLAYFHIRNIFQKIAWKKINHLKEDMNQAIRSLVRFPDLIQRMSKRELKIIFAYRRFAFWGYLRLKYYMSKKKI